MPRRWIGLLLLSIGFIAGVAFARAGTPAAGSQGTPTATPPGYVVDGFAAETLASLPGPGPKGLFGAFAAGDPPEPISIELLRYTLEPGGRLVMPYPFPGPVLVYVDDGMLQLDALGPNVRLVYRESEENWTHLGLGILEAGKPYALETRDAAYAMDGLLGPVSNPGDRPVTLLVIFVQRYAFGDSASEETTAMPADG